MIVRPKSRVGLLMFEPREHQVLVDLEAQNRDLCEVREFGTSVVINNGDDILWNDPEDPRDWVVLIDNRPQTSSIHSVLKGTSGEIETFNVNYSNQGIVGIFKLLRQPLRHQVFTQRWRVSYSLPKKRIIISSHPTSGLQVRTYSH